MNCDRALALMVDAAGGTVPHGDRRDLEAHLKGCASCAAAMQEFSVAHPAVHAALRQTDAAPAPGFDDRVRASVADQAALDDRSRRRWLPRLVFAGLLTAVVVATLSVVISEVGTEVRMKRTSDVPIESAISLVSPDSIYEVQTRDEVADVEEALFSEAFGRNDLDAIDRALDGEVEEQIEEMDDASLKAFEEQLASDGKNKSG